MNIKIKVEKSKNGYGAYVPDLPGVGVVSDTREEVIKDIRKAIKMHIEDMQENEKKIPKRKSEIFKLEVA